MNDEPRKENDNDRDNDQDNDGLLIRDDVGLWVKPTSG